jgi:hypothetical protein
MIAIILILLFVWEECTGLKTDSRSFPLKARDDLLRNANSIFSGIFGAYIVTNKAPSVDAKVFFDTDTYGDKELKIATVNRIKQRLRNAILQDNTVAPIMMRLAINDALGYTALTDEGGPDGSIQYEMKFPANEGLEKALAAVIGIKKELQRTNAVSMADIVAFAGGEALETVGLGRVIVQVGRVDTKSSNGDAKVINWNKLDGSILRQSFETSGLTPKDIALLCGALGEIERITAETIEANRPADRDSDDDEFEPTPFVPSTFGARDNMYGAKMGKANFGVQYIRNVVKGKETSSLAKALMSDSEIKEILKKYAGNEDAFKKDVSEAYLKMTLLGQTFMTRNS